VKINSLGLKISLVVTLLIAVIIVPVILIVTVQTDALVSGLTDAEAKAANQTLVKAMQDYQDDAALRAELISISSDLSDAIVNNNPLVIERVLDSNSEGLDEITICDMNGIVIKRLSSDETGDRIQDGSSLAEALRTG